MTISVYIDIIVATYKIISFHSLKYTPCFQVGKVKRILQIDEVISHSTIRRTQKTSSLVQLKDLTYHQLTRRKSMLDTTEQYPRLGFTSTNNYSWISTETRRARSPMIPKSGT